MPARLLTPRELVTRCDPATLGIGEVPTGDVRAIVGQQRARAAIDFGIGAARSGHHLFVMGPRGSGKQSLVRDAIAAQLARGGVERFDWVYVNNFEQPHKPLALRLPQGRGAQLRQHMRTLVQDLRTMIPATFESEDYANAVERLNNEYKERADQAVLAVGEEVLIDKIIGAGEIAVSDHRSSQPSFEEIARLASECRVGGMLGGKAGVLHLHLGDGKRGLELLFRLVRETEIPPAHVVPTHINRNPRLFEEGLAWVAAGGSIDVTVGPDPAPPDPEVAIEDAIARFRDKGLRFDRMMANSDSTGSLPVFDANGRLVRLTIASEKDLYRKFADILRANLLPVETAVWHCQS